MKRASKPDPAKKQVSTVHLDTQVHERLLKIVGMGAMEGVKLSYRMIVAGALNSLSDEQLLKAAKKQADKEENAA